MSSPSPCPAHSCVTSLHPTALPDARCALPAFLAAYRYQSSVHHKERHSSAREELSGSPPFCHGCFNTAPLVFLMSAAPTYTLLQGSPQTRTAPTHTKSHAPHYCCAQPGAAMCLQLPAELQVCYLLPGEQQRGAQGAFTLHCEGKQQLLKVN